MLCKRVETLFSQHGLTFNKGSVAKRIAAEVRTMKSWADLPTITQQRAALLFAAIAVATESLAKSHDNPDSAS